MATPKTLIELELSPVASFTDRFEPCWFHVAFFATWPHSIFAVDSVFSSFVYVVDEPSGDCVGNPVFDDLEFFSGIVSSGELLVGFCTHGCV